MVGLLLSHPILEDRRAGPAGIETNDLIRLEKRLSSTELGLSSLHCELGRNRKIGRASAWVIALPVQFLGLFVERWFFFAQARHPQNIYYQSVS